MSAIRVAYVALGTNVGGEHLGLNVDRALHLLKRTQKVHLVNTSSLYRSRATEFGAVVRSQRDYYNCVAELRTRMDPLSLLRVLKQVEKDMGRDFGARRHGPRVIDLDLLFFGDESASFPKSTIRMDTEELTLPHPRIFERDFVVEPLKEILSNDAQLELKPGASQTLTGVVASYGPYLEWIRGETCKHVAIMNATPDSFSDGGTLSEPYERAQKLKSLGAEALDVGGESTRPGAPSVSIEEELARVKPVLEQATKVYKAISIDTFKPEVASKALDWGATVVNDVTGGQDERMLSLVADRPGTGIVLMHSKGNPRTMDKLSNSYGKDDIVEAVCDDLRIKVDSALKAGIPRWRIMVDPGIGFAKSHQDSFKLLSSSNAMREHLGRNMLVMIGHSRKRFLKPSFLQLDPSADWPSLAVREEVNAKATQVAIDGGADVVRIHYA